MASMLVDLYASWFGPAAPPVGAVNDTNAPEGAINDPLGQAHANNPAPVQAVHSKTDGYLPSWKFKQPPGVGDAPQFVWSTFALAPLSIDGPGDRPATYFRWKQPLQVANFVMRYNGMAVDGGNFLMTGLYVPDPLTNPTQAVLGTDSGA